MLIGENDDTFPPYYASMVRAGEASGALDVVLGRLGEFLEKSQALRETVKTALYYPIFLLIMAVLSIVVLLTVVVPQFKPLFESAGAALPLSTRSLIAVGDFIRDDGWLLLIAIRRDLFSFPPLPLDQRWTPTVGCVPLAATASRGCANQSRRRALQPNR